jgi:GcrA cell cycle regulator
MSWTDERVETLKKMWSDGQSASQIAKELGGVTRNAVIGKVHRLGLSNRVGAGAEMPAATPASASASAARVDDDGARAATPTERGADEPGQTLRNELRGGAQGSGVPRGEAAVVSLMTPQRKAIVPAGQPLPPQPSANEISPETLASVREMEKRARKLTLMELTERTCKWPIGDPATEHFWFCGLPSVAGKPYCESHVGVAFQPMSARRDRRR